MNCPHCNTTLAVPSGWRGAQEETTDTEHSYVMECPNDDCEADSFRIVYRLEFDRIEEV